MAPGMSCGRIKKQEKVCCIPRARTKLVRILYETSSTQSLQANPFYANSRACPSSQVEQPFTFFCDNIINRPPRSPGLSSSRFFAAFATELTHFALKLIKQLLEHA